MIAGRKPLLPSPEGDSGTYSPIESPTDTQRQETET